MPYKPESLDQVLARFPEASRTRVAGLFKSHIFLFKITMPRATRLGSFRRGSTLVRPIISVNGDLGKHWFLLVFLHELAHLQVAKQYSRRAQPHGKEWKQTFRQITAPFLEDQVFPDQLSMELKRFFLNPLATFQSDSRLLQALSEADGAARQITVNDVPENSLFILTGGRQFIKKQKLRTRFKCLCPVTRRYFLVAGSATVVKIIPVAEK
jgi:hypothetical protein